MQAWLSLSIMVATLVLILARPRGISEAWVAASAAILTVLLGIVPVRGVVGVLAQTADVLLFLLGMMVLTILVEQAGVFDHFAEGFVRLSRGSGPLLFCSLFVLGALVTVFLSLDSTIVILTPVIYSVVSRRRLDAVPFMFACTFVANTSSLALPISNLTNLLVYSQLHIPFGVFAARMWFPTVVAVIVNLGIFMALFRDRLSARFDAEGSDELTKIDGWFLAASATMVLTIAGVIALGVFDLPPAWASLSGAASLVGIGVLKARVRVREVIGEVSWSLFAFVIGMFVVVHGFERSWLVDPNLGLPSDPTGSLLAAVVVGALGSNITNNVPLTILGISLISHLPSAVQHVAAFGLLVGANIGPALTTYGSLATILWLTLIRRRGIDIATTEYLKIGLITVPPVLMAATLSLWMVQR